MTLTLDTVTERRIQQELALGQFQEPSELISHALDLIEAERLETDERRAKIIARLEHSFAQSEHGESYSSEEARAILSERLARRR